MQSASITRYCTNVGDGVLWQAMTWTNGITRTKTSSKHHQNVLVGKRAKNVNENFEFGKKPNCGKPLTTNEELTWNTFRVKANNRSDIGTLNNQIAVTLEPAEIKQIHYFTQSHDICLYTNDWKITLAVDRNFPIKLV